MSSLTGVENALNLLVQNGLPAVIKSNMTREQFHRFVLTYSDIKIERDCFGKITIHPPMTLDSGYLEGLVFTRLSNWALSNGLGRAFSPSTSFDMPDGAQFKADGAWILMEKINRLTKTERSGIPVLVPDFVIELRSKSDRLAKLKRKMTEGWMANGVQLAWLIDPLKESAWIYRAGRAVEELAGFDRVLSGEALLPGFTLALGELKV